MNTERFCDAMITQSWGINAPSWTTAVREGQIETRKLVTDQAIVDTILNHRPDSVLDIGCGEGWLVRELARCNIRVIGTDVIPALIDEARRVGGGDFYALSYEEIAAGKLKVSVDVIVCNFALLGKESVEGLFKVIPTLLTSRGTFIIQTLHPVVACGELPYRDGWREGSWAGFSTDFSDPPPWYFRTLESWIKLFVDHGFQLSEVHEPINPKNQKPASIIFTGKPAG